MVRALRVSDRGFRMVDMFLVSLCEDALFCMGVGSGFLSNIHVAYE